METIILLEDTRQQAGKHDKKHEWFINNGVHINRCTLVCGDYQLPGDGSRAVDTKKDIQELIGDIQYKALNKSEIEKRVRNTCITYRVNIDPREIYHLITDDDSERFPEKEISDFCMAMKIPEDAMMKFQDLYVKRHGFFHRGLVRAKQYGVKLFVLVENQDGVTDINSLFRWVNPRSKIFVNSNKQVGYWRNGKPKYLRVQKYPNCMQGQQLAKACITMQYRYGCEFLFCSPEQSGEIIVGLLEGGEQDGKEANVRHVGYRQ